MEFHHTTIERWESGPYRIERVDGGRYMAMRDAGNDIEWFGFYYVGDSDGYTTLPEAIAACEEHAGGKA